MGAGGRRTLVPLSPYVASSQRAAPITLSPPMAHREARRLVDGWIMVSLGVLYAAVLFAAAWLGDQDRFAQRLDRHAPTLYALSLAVFCTSWTFYGAVGTAVTSGWEYVPIYLGPACVFLFAPGVVRRVIAVSRRHNLTTISDFLAARYGRSRTLATAVTVLAALGALPYIALQLKSVTMSFAAVTAASGSGLPAAGGEPDRVGVLAVTAVLALFAIVFGARSSDAASRNRGLVLAIAMESVVKITALVVVAAVAMLFLMGAIAPQAGAVRTVGLSELFPVGSPTLTFITLTGLAMAAVVCLPRQFHMTVTEAPASGEAKAFARARWLFPAYLAITSVVVIPIALAGAAIAPAGASPDLFVLTVPTALGAEAVAAMAFLGGVSAATGMIVVATVALSTMVTQDLVVPLLIRRRRESAVDLAGGRLLLIRRAVIAGLMLLSYGYWAVAGDSAALADMGLIAFVAAAQLAPAMVGGLYWRGGRRNGVLAGLAAGGVLWAYTLVLPAMLGEAGLAASGLQTAFGGVIDPHGLIGGGGADPVTHGALVSLIANVAAYIVVSARARARIVDTVQAAAFVNHRPDQNDEPALAGEDAAPFGFGDVAGAPPAHVTAHDLRSLAERFLSLGAVSAAFERFADERGAPIAPEELADWPLVQKTERLLAGALGSSTARIVMSSALSRGDVSFIDMLSVLDETSADRRFERHLLQATLENITQGVSVVDKDMRLIAWNGVYLDLFQFPPGLVRVGRPIADIIRVNAERGEMGPGDVEAQVARRLAALRAGGPHSYERVNKDGRALKIVGNPMPGGGYVTTFTDITAEKRAEHALRDAKETLERRVEERTRDLASMAEDLDRARQIAERSEVTKTRFLAAASHDLQQPLHAARLFAAALSARLDDAGSVEGRLAGNVDRSIRSAHQMLTGLLDLSKFDQGGLRPTMRRVSLARFFDELAHDNRPIAEETGLELRVRDTPLWVHTDADLLRSVVQNLVSNALRYTQTGGVLIAARARQGGCEAVIEIWDTGPGIPEDAQGRIFQEFRRLHTKDRFGARGAGLGLAIASRAAALLGARVSLRSVVGRGSKFWIAVPVAPPAPTLVTSAPGEVPASPTALQGLRVLCLDDEPAVREATQAVLREWGCDAQCVADAEAAVACNRDRGPFDVALVDYWLGADAPTGLDVLERMRTDGVAPARAALISADPSLAVRARAQALGCAVIAKPLNSHVLRDFLVHAPRNAAE